MIQQTYFTVGQPHLSNIIGRSLSDQHFSYFNGFIWLIVDVRTYIPAVCVLFSRRSLRGIDFLCFPSCMLHAPNHIAPHLRPINTRIQLLIHQPTNSNILPSYKIKPVANLGARFRIIMRPYYALDCLAQDKVRQLIAGKESAS